MSPKALARLIRFDEAHTRLWNAPRQSLTTLAYELGYADQAHFSREFRALAAIPPSAFAAEARAWRKRHEDVAFVQAHRPTETLPSRA